MPDNGEAKKNTDASDVLIEFGKVLIAFAGKWYVWATLALIVVIRSEWASPESLGRLVADVISAWKCTP